MTQPASREGQPVPQVRFRYRADGDWKETSTEALFKGRTVAVFSLPGAFTPTCSSTHLPRFNELAPVFRENGVDEIVCVAVNDPFVMEEWARSQECSNVFLLPDGNGAFTSQMGMLVDKSDLNFGQRSWRYSMLVRDGVVEKMFIEPDAPGDPFEVSDADTLLHYVNKDAKQPDEVALLTREGCAFCTAAKNALNDAGITFAEVDLPHSIRTRALGAIAGARTVPQLFVNGRLIGGGEALQDWVRRQAPA
ncbi:glutathione peroxidase [Acidovorax sp. BL-A-41-H1]|uniref:glutathione peroxidase n=1 Tax=Acidovorax sp. BL-A-41-H1 TaxID=3421102 RepID=UPI003F7A5175